MADKVNTTEAKAPVAEGAPAAAPAPRRGPGHRGADVRDTVAEMTEKAQLLSLEAGSKVAGAMKDVIYAAAGITGFAIESARDLVQYMVRRGQMRSEEADKLMREVEDAHSKRKPTGLPTRAELDARVAAARAAEAPRPTPAATPAVSNGPRPPAAPAATAPAVVAPAPAQAPVVVAKVAKVAKPAAKAPAKSAKSAKPAKTTAKAARRPPAAKAAKSGAKKSAKKR